MKTLLLIAMILFEGELFRVVLRAEPTDPQKDAVAAFPDLGKAGSPLHLKFMELYKRAKEAKSPVLSQANWPLLLAREAFVAVEDAAKAKAATAIAAQRINPGAEEIITAVGKLTIEDPRKLVNKTAKEWSIEPVTKDNIADLFAKAGRPMPANFNDFFGQVGAMTTVTTSSDSNVFVAVRKFDDGSCIGTFQTFEFPKRALLPPSAISSANCGVSFLDKNNTKHSSTEFGDAVSRELARNGFCRAGIIFANGTLFECLFRTTDDFPVYVDFDSSFHQKGAYSPSDYNIKFYVDGFITSISSTCITIGQDVKKTRIIALKK